MPNAPEPAIKLVLTDIDGTILPYGHDVVPARTRAAFHACLDAGIRVGPASGRAVSHVAPAFANDVACTATALAINGMHVYLDGELIVEKLVDHAGLVHLSELLQEMDHAGMVVFDGATPLLVCGDAQDLFQVFPRYASELGPHVGGVPDQPIVKANVFIPGSMEQTRAKLAYIQQQVPELGFNLPCPGFLNVVPLGWSKANGIDALCERLGIGLDQVVVFGDGGNDVEMLAHVPHSAAVADAVPEARAAATYVIGSCEDESVATCLEALARGAWPFG